MDNRCVHYELVFGQHCWRLGCMAFSAGCRFIGIEILLFHARRRLIGVYQRGARLIAGVILVVLYAFRIEISRRELVYLKAANVESRGMKEQATR